MTYNNDVHPKTISTTVDWTWDPTEEEPMGVWIQPPDYTVGGHRNSSIVNDTSTWWGAGFESVAFEATWPIDEGIAAGPPGVPAGASRWGLYIGESACVLLNAYNGLRRWDIPEIEFWESFNYTSYPCIPGSGQYDDPEPDLYNVFAHDPAQAVNAVGALVFVEGGVRFGVAQFQNYTRAVVTEGIWYFKLNPVILTAGGTGVRWDFTQTPGWPAGGPGWAPPTGGLGISGQATQEQVAQWAANAGFSGNALAIAVAVAFAESSWVVDATHVNEDGSIDSGLWQINSVHTASGFSVANAFDPVYNAQWAYRISSGGTDWTPWTTYNSGAYLQYLGGAIEVVGDLRGGTIPSGSPQPLAQPALARSIEFESNVATVVGAKLEGSMVVAGGQGHFTGEIEHPTAESVTGQIRVVTGDYWPTHDYGTTVSYPFFRYDIGFPWYSRSRMASLPLIFSTTLPADEELHAAYFGDWYVQNPIVLSPTVDVSAPIPSIDISQYIDADGGLALMVTSQNQIDATIPTWSPPVGEFEAWHELVHTQQYRIYPSLGIRWTIRPPRHRWLPSVSQANGEPKRVIYEHVKSVPTDYWG